MTLQRADGPLAYELGGPPAGDIVSVVSWVYDLFRRLVDLQTQPRPISIVMARLEVGDEQVKKPEQGMLIYAARDVVGSGQSEGVYFYAGGVWRPVCLVP